MNYKLKSKLSFKLKEKEKLQQIRVGQPNNKHLRIQLHGGNASNE
jgi:hypothetical protein